MAGLFYEPRTPNIAIFLDFDNVAIGVRNAHYGSFKVDLVLERLLDKGNIVLKKAYADWGRYPKAKRPLHEAAFELIEIPHVSMSGKNSADIRLVVDALDLCYTKDHIDLFVIVSGDSDFSPLVSKLRENNKQVIALGVKNSTSNLLVENCDEFIYYDDLVRQRPERAASKKNGRTAPVEAAEEPSAPEPSASSAAEAKSPPSPPSPPNSPSPPTAETTESLRIKALEMVLDTVEGLFRDRDEALWASEIKQTLKRKRPNFSEAFHGYASFSKLLKDAEERKLLELERDSRSRSYKVIGFGPLA